MIDLFKRIIFILLSFIKFSLGRTKKYFTAEQKVFYYIAFDLLVWLLRERQFNFMYYAMGLNLKTKTVEDYIGKFTFLRVKEKTEKLLKSKLSRDDYSYEILTKDKFYAASILSANGFRCPELFGIIYAGAVYNAQLKATNLETLLEPNREYVFKNTVIEAGDGVMICKTNHDGFCWIDGDFLDLDILNKRFGNSVWIIQEKLYSHADLQVFNNSALNTTRIVTMLNNGSPDYLTGFQSFATNNALIDSWSSGSIYVGINIEDETLKKYAFASVEDKRFSLLTRHPDSNISFENTKIPFLNDAINICRKAHLLFPYNFILGWDIAITNDGPVFIEVNEKPGMNVVQCVDGGLRFKILKTASF